MGSSGLNQKKNAPYASLAQACLFGKRLEPSCLKRKFPRQTQYDFSCGEIIMDEVSKRIYKTCGLYHGTIKARVKHERWCVNRSKKTNTQQQLSFPRVKPVRVAAKRGREVMSIMEYQEAEWLSLDECELDGLDIPEGNASSGTPLIAPEDRAAIWE